MKLLERLMHNLKARTGTFKMHNKLSKVWLTRADECFQVNFPPKKLWREVSKSNGSNITLASRCVLFLSFPSFLPLSLASALSAFIHDVCAASIPYTLCRRARAHAWEHFIMRLCAGVALGKSAVIIQKWRRRTFLPKLPLVPKTVKIQENLIRISDSLTTFCSTQQQRRRPNPLCAPPERLNLIL